MEVTCFKFRFESFCTCEQGLQSAMGAKLNGCEGVVETWNVWSLADFVRHAWPDTCVPSWMDFNHGMIKQTLRLRRVAGTCESPELV